MGKYEISRLIIQWINLQICNTFFFKERVADYKYWIYIMMTFPILFYCIYLCNLFKAFKNSDNKKNILLLTPNIPTGKILKTSNGSYLVNDFEE